MKFNLRKTFVTCCIAALHTSGCGFPPVNVPPSGDGFRLFEGPPPAAPSTIAYTFLTPQDDPGGTNHIAPISDEEKDLVREVLREHSSRINVNFVETTKEGLKSVSPETGHLVIACVDKFNNAPKGARPAGRALIYTSHGGALLLARDSDPDKFQDTVKHELGHILGLDHVYAPPERSVMHPMSASLRTTNTPEPMPDDQTTLQKIWGKRRGPAP